MSLAARSMRLLPWMLPQRPGRLVERNLLVYRRAWMLLVSGLFEPVLYLLGIGFGLGSLVGRVEMPGGHAVSYAVFVAPALMATAAMNGAIYDSTFNVFFKLKYQKLYDGVLSTPLATGDIAVGEVTWALIRGTIYSCCFLLAMVVLRLVASPLALLAIPAAMLVGFAFAAVGCAITTFLTGWQDFDLVMLGLTPLFLFSATFFPVSVYPPALQVVVQFSPLYRGVDLIRALTTGNLSGTMLVDVVFLVALGLVGVAVTSRRLGRLLLT